MIQYELVIVNLDPTIGSEIKKTRPCVIISPNEMNSVLNTVIIVPITSNKKKYPTRIKINKSKITGMIALDQIRTIDKKRITINLGMIPTKTIVSIKEVINEMLVK
jgi:mRNA interferase MazF